MPSTHIVCYSGGHSSARVAIAVRSRFPGDTVILLNHDICPRVEEADIKRFKVEVANLLRLPVTYANYPNWYTMDQFDICVKHSAFKIGRDQVLCTHRLKTEPFLAWLGRNFPTDPNNPRRDVVIYYGFDASEGTRIQRRVGIMSAIGYRTDYPLALWASSPELARFIPQSTLELGITPPLTYSAFKHANCTGCIKAGAQHWYAVFCMYPEIFKKAMWAEEQIGYSIMREYSLAEKAPFFQLMQARGVVPTEHVPQQKFWVDAKRMVAELKRANCPISKDDTDCKPCECVF